jgi:adenylate kinase
MATYILLMGVQGAGKGTQAARLVETLGLLHVSTGELFRAMKVQDTPLAREVQATMNRGELIGDALTVRVVRERITQPDAARGVIFDGFPRTVPQAEALDALLAELGGAVNTVFSLELGRDVAFRRLEGRRVCAVNEKHVYNVYFNPPQVAGVCDVDGAPLMQRPDDTPDAVTKRIEAYYAQTAPLLHFYRERGLLREIDADQAIESVTAALLAALEGAPGGISGA